MKSMVIKRAAAALTAMVMAVSMMAMGVSADVQTEEQLNVASITGVTSTSVANDTRSAYGIGKNYTGLSRLVYVQAKIFSEAGDYGESHDFVVTNGDRVNSGTITRSIAKSKYSQEMILLYNGTVTMSGEYAKVYVTVQF